MNHLLSGRVHRQEVEKVIKQTLILAGAALAIMATPAAAKPGKGHGNQAKHADHAAMGHVGYGAGGCPPGLAKKNNGCMPPGQAKKLYNVGQRFPLRYGNMWNFDQLPYDLRRQYGFGPNQNYYYGDGYIYQVDPNTMLIQQAVSAILR